MKSLLATCLVLSGLPSNGQIPVFAEPKAATIGIPPDVIDFNRQQKNGSTSPSTILNAPYPNASPQEQKRYADQEIRRYEMSRSQSLVDEANNELEARRIEYELPFTENPDKKFYFETFSYLQKVLNDQESINLEAAVFLVERAFDPSLDYNEFNQQLAKAVNVIGLKMQQDKISPLDNVGKIMTAFRFMSDTLTVYSKKNESRITTYPKTYDFEDFWGNQDYKKMFVSKLIREGSGQCHSMPLYFLILCERMNANASLSFAPNHSFVKFQDKRGGWHNIELTNGVLASDHFMVESGYIKAEALQNKIYLQPLSKKQTIVQCLNDLALGYIKKYGLDNFVKACTKLAIDNDRNSLSAHQINANYYMTLDSYVRYQYKVKGLSKEAYMSDERAKAIYESAIGANKFIENLGYSEMPQAVYEAWLKSAQKEAVKQQHSREVKVLGGMIETK